MEPRNAANPQLSIRHVCEALALFLKTVYTQEELDAIGDRLSELPEEIDRAREREARAAVDALIRRLMETPEAAWRGLIRAEPRETQDYFVARVGDRTKRLMRGAEPLRWEEPLEFRRLFELLK